MKTVRSNTFETNSSSTHSITIDRVNYPNLQIPKTITIEGSTFGWEYERFNDFVRKASYFWTLANYDEVIRDRMLRLSELYGFDLIEPEKDSHGWCSDTYVDHGCEHYASWIAENPSLNTDEGLWEFLTSESCWIMLGNDNNAAPPNWGDTPKATAAMPYRVYVWGVDPEDYISPSTYELKTPTPDIASNIDAINAMVDHILEQERSSYDEPYTEWDNPDENGDFVVRYYTYNYKTNKKEYVRERKLRIEID